jgi:lipopolysaccharide/colanic/teichoic acid biosynthesis glycosyltransferase
MLMPVIVVIAVAIKLDSPGPVLYQQDRTATFGETFPVYKFRTLKPTTRDVDLDIDENRRTPLGDFLRTTHLDEIPQLWSILTGDMSVVGPRPAITELEWEYVDQVSNWRQRWFVKPGLTGLAQINDATGHEPRAKLRYDIKYIRDQSLSYDTKIIFRQLLKIASDIAELIN